MQDIVTFWLIVLNSFVLLFISVGLDLHYKRKWSSTDGSGGGGSNGGDTNGGGDCPVCPDPIDPNCPDPVDPPSETDCVEWFDSFAPNLYTVASFTYSSETRVPDVDAYRYFADTIVRQVERTKRMTNFEFDLLSSPLIDKNWRDTYYAPTVSFAVLLTNLAVSDETHDLFTRFGYENQPVVPANQLNVDAELFRVYASRITYSVYNEHAKTVGGKLLPADNQYMTIVHFLDTFTVPDYDTNRPTANDWTKDGYAYDNTASGLNRMLDLVRYLYIAWSARRRSENPTAPADNYANFRAQIEYAYVRLRIALDRDYVQARGAENRVLTVDRNRARILACLLYASRMTDRKLGKWYVRQLAYTEPGGQVYPLITGADVCSSLIDNDTSQADDLVWPLVFTSRSETFAIVRNDRFMLEIAYKQTRNQISDTLIDHANLLTGYLNYGADYGRVLREYQGSRAKEIPVQVTFAGQYLVDDDLFVPTEATVLSTTTDVYNVFFYSSEEFRASGRMYTKNGLHRVRIESTMNKNFSYTLFSWTARNKLVTRVESRSIRIYDYDRTLVVESETHNLNFYELDLGPGAINGCFYTVYALIPAPTSNTKVQLDYTVRIVY